MSVLWAFIGPLLYLTLLSIVGIYIFKKRFNFQIVLPIVLIAATLFVYLFTFITHSITTGLVVTVAVAAMAIPMLLFDKARVSTLKTLLLTPAFFIFITLYTLLFAFHYNSVLSIFSDDLMHWAPHVWTMWMRDDFYTSPGLSIVIHGDYIPILQLFQLMWVKIAGEYREGLLYVALEITCFAMLFPLLKNLVWSKAKAYKTIILSTLILAVMLIVPTLIDVTHVFYNSLHPDYAIAFVFVFGAYIAITQSRKFSWSIAVILSLAITFLCLTKQSSILFAGLIGIMYLCGLYVSYNATPRAIAQSFVAYVKNWRKNWRGMVAIILLLALPLISLRLWQAQIKDYDNPYCCVAIFSISASDVLQVPGVLLGNEGNESQQTYARDFFRYILTYQAGFTTHILSNVSYTQFILLFIAAMIFVGYNYKDKFRRSRIVIITVVVIGGWLLYAFAIYLTFLFGGMIDSERNNLLTGDRYLRTYIIALVLILFGILVSFIIRKHNEAKSGNKTLAVFAASLLLFIGIFFNIDLIKNGYLVESLKFDNAYGGSGITNEAEFANKFRTFTQSIGGTYEDPRGIVVSEQPDVQTIYYLRYLAIPNRVENGSDLVIDSKSSKDEVCDTLAENGYFFIKHEYSKKSLRILNDCIVNDFDSVKMYDAYKIQRTEDGELELVKHPY